MKEKITKEIEQYIKRKNPWNNPGDIAKIISVIKPKIFEYMDDFNLKFNTSEDNSSPVSFKESGFYRNINKAVIEIINDGVRLLSDAEIMYKFVDIYERKY